MQARSIPLAWVLIAAIVVTALIALNRGVDLLWGITLLLMLATAVAVALPRLQVRGVQVQRGKFPATAVVGERVTVSYRVEKRAFLPRYGIEVHDNLAGGSTFTPSAFLPSIGRSEVYEFAWTPRTRGCWQLHDLRLESRYPLGLVKSSRRVAAPAHDIVVYPDFVRLHSLPVRNDAHPRFERMISPRRGGRDEFFGVKQYVAGDEVRSIHWRASARRDELVVKEFEHQQDRQLWILLDLAEGQHTGIGATSTVEAMIRIAHSIAVKAFEDGIPVGVLYRVADGLQQIPASSDRSTYERIRDALARVNAHAQLPLARWAQRLREQLPSGGTWVMFNLGGMRERNLLERVAARRLATPLFVEFETPSFERGVVDADARVTTHASSRYFVSTVPFGADLADLFRP
jgi:uncharacterized protein (DUF58 family)